MQLQCLTRRCIVTPYDAAGITFSFFANELRPGNYCKSVAVALTAKTAYGSPERPSQGLQRYGCVNDHGVMLYGAAGITVSLRSY